MKTLRITACMGKGEGKLPPVKIGPWKGGSKRNFKAYREKVRQDARDLAMWLHCSAAGMWVQALTDELKRLETATIAILDKKGKVS